MTGSDRRDVSAASAPRLLSRSADAPAGLPTVRGSEEVASLHVSWAELVRGGGPAGDAGGAPGGVRAKVRARVVAAAGAQAAADRALIGDLIRAVDLIAARLDDFTERLGNVEVLVQEVVDRLSEDLTRVQVALGTLDPPRDQVGDAGDDR